RSTNAQMPAAAAAKLPAAAAAARRPTGSATALEEVEIRLRGGFGEHLVRCGVLSRAALFRVLRAQDEEGGRIGDAVVRLGLADRDEIEELVAEYEAEVAAQRFSAVA